MMPNMKVGIRRRRPKQQKSQKQQRRHALSLNAAIVSNVPKCRPALPASSSHSAPTAPTSTESSLHDADTYDFSHHGDGNWDDTFHTSTDSDDDDDDTVASTSTSSTISISEVFTRSVHFAPMDSIHPIAGLQDYTEKEIEDCWFQTEDFDLAQRKARKLLSKMRHGTANQYCTRGLEKLFGERLEVARETRRQAYDAVAEAQLEERAWLQRADAIDHVIAMGDRVARAYSAVATACIERARIMADNDAAVVKPYLRRNGKKSRSSNKTKRKGSMGPRTQQQTPSPAKSPRVSTTKRGKKAKAAKQQQQ